VKDGPITNILKQTRLLSPEDSIGRAVSLMRTSQSQSLPVIEHGRVVGVLTESLLLSHLTAGGTEDARVGSIIDRNPPCASIYFSIAQAADMMNREHVEILPVIDEFGEYRGVVNVSDVVALEFNLMRPPSIGGMATPLGVHLTTGATSAGPGSLGLFLSGAALVAMFVVGRGILLLLAMLADHLLGTHLISQITSPPTGGLSLAALRIDAVYYISLVLQLTFMMILLRFSPMSSYHAAEHQVVHTIEAGEPLKPEIVRRMPRAHPRCGTNLMVAAALFMIVSSFIGREYGIIIAIIVVITGWRSAGYYLQQYVTTKPPKEHHIQSGIKAGEELLAKYQRNPNKSIDGFSRVWSMGIIQVAAGFFAVQALVRWLFPNLLGVMGVL
jgi:hypothetical protein